MTYRDIMKPASAPELSARRKASGAPGAIRIRTIPTFSTKLKPNMKLAAIPIIGTIIRTLVSPRVSKTGERGRSGEGLRKVASAAGRFRGCRQKLFVYRGINLGGVSHGV
jgi:hypothetical protein